MYYHMYFINEQQSMCCTDIFNTALLNFEFKAVLNTFCIRTDHESNDQWNLCNAKGFAFNVVTSSCVKFFLASSKS